MQNAPTFRALFHADNESKLLPDVKQMLATFEVVPPASQSRGHAKP